MNAQTLEALKASIAKWERNAEAKTPDEFVTTPCECPLCMLFLNNPAHCRGCPVLAKTGEQFCRKTPYREAADAKTDWYDEIDDAANRAHAAARDEVAFLKSLLPVQP